MFQKPQTYAVQETLIDIPPSLMPNPGVRPIIVNNKQVVVQNQASSVANSNGRLEFVLPSTNTGYIKPNSMYLSFKVTPLPAATATNWNFAGPCGSAASLISRAIIRVNGVNCEQIERYNDVHNLLLAHTSSSGYYNVDSVLLERPFKTPDYKAAASTNINAGGSSANNLVDICLPLQFQLFTSNHAFPLWLCPPNSCQVTLELSNYVDAFVQNQGAVAITDLQVSEAQLIFDMAEVSPDFVVSMRQKMAGGFSYNLPYLQIRQQALTDAGTVTFNFGLSASSVKAVLYYCKLAKSLSSAAAAATGFTAATVGGFTRNATAVSSIRVFADGQLLNSSNMQNLTQQYSELNKALGKINDQLSTSAADMVTNSSFDARTLYNTQFYTVGLGLSGITDPYGMGAGRPISTLTLEVNKTLDAAGAQAISHVLYDSVLSIDGMGNVLPQQ